MNHSYSYSSCNSYRESSSGWAKFFRVVLYIVLAFILIDVGLWLIGTALGLAIGLFALALVLAPVLFVGWFFWLVIKAIFF